MPPPRTSHPGARGRIGFLDEFAAATGAGAADPPFAPFAVGLLVDECTESRWPSEFAFSLVARNIQLVLVREPEDDLPARLQQLRRTARAVALVGRFARIPDLGAYAGNDGVVVHGLGTGAEYTVIADRADDGWDLYELAFGGDRYQPSTAMAIAGLRLRFDLDPGEDRRIGVLREKLMEAGAALSDAGPVSIRDPDLRLCRDIDGLDPGCPAAALNLADPQDEALAVWIQTIGLSGRFLPEIAHGLEAVAATPLNQWRRWML